MDDYGRLFILINGLYLQDTTGRRTGILLPVFLVCECPDRLGGGDKTGCGRIRQDAARHGPNLKTVFSFVSALAFRYLWIR